MQGLSDDAARLWQRRILIVKSCHRAGNGLLFGAVLWAVNDELLNSTLRLAGPPDAYPLSSHLRGLIGHLVLGVATDVGIELADRLRP